MKHAARLFLSVSLGSAPAWAEVEPRSLGFGDQTKEYQLVGIPGARCGDGSPYGVYVKPGRADKVLFHLEGGGACWSRGTCVFPQITKLKVGGVIGALDGRLAGNPFLDHTYVYFPYCTGDLYYGRHVASYGTRHEGRLNVGLALAELERSGTVKLSRVDDVVVFGESAGALGVLGNLDQMHAATPRARYRTALVDSPGLHFADDIWSNFDAPYVEDIRYALARNHVQLDVNSGLVGHQMGAFCGGRPEWKIGFAQGARDIVMSRVFGGLSTSEHRKLVYGPKGIFRATENPDDNCAAWVPDSILHVYAPWVHGWHYRTRDGVSNGEFNRAVYESARGAPLPNHR